LPSLRGTAYRWVVPRCCFPRACCEIRQDTPSAVAGEMRQRNVQLGGDRVDTLVAKRYLKRIAEVKSRYWEIEFHSPGLDETAFYGVA
jgi:hypothetical protein